MAKVSKGPGSARCSPSSAAVVDGVRGGRKGAGQGEHPELAEGLLKLASDDPLVGDDDGLGG